MAKVGGSCIGYRFPDAGGVIAIQVWTCERNPDLIAAIEASALPVMLEKALEADPGHPVVYLLGNSGSDVQTSGHRMAGDPATAAFNASSTTLARSLHVTSG